MESTARKQMETTLKEVAKDPASVKVSNVETKFANDSLCILNADFTAKNALGEEVRERCEYVYVSSNGKQYEAYQEISSNDDCVFQTEEQYNKDKKGKIYESLPYADGLRYLSVVFVNTNGREAGVKEGNHFSIPVPTGTGAWQLNSSMDEFGEKGNAKYLYLVGKGNFSNSAATGEELTAVLFVEKSELFAVRLLEYDSNIVKNDGFYDCKIKDSNGDIYEFEFANDEDYGDLHLFGMDKSKDLNNMQKILNCGGVITVSIKEKYAYSTPSVYLFKIDVSGYTKAKKFL